jgi:hypothetical protein
MKFKDQTLGTSAFCFIDNMPNMQISEYHSLPGYDTVLASTGPQSSGRCSRVSSISTGRSEGMA